MGLVDVARKHVFGVSDKVSFKPVSTATEISLKIEISPKASLHKKKNQKANNNGADQTAQMRRLVCAFVVCKPLKTGFLRRCLYYALLALARVEAKKRAFAFL